MPLGTNNMTTTTGAKFIPDVWSAAVLRAAQAHLVMAERVKRYDSEVSEKGAVIHIPNLSNLVANDKTQGSQVTLQSPTEVENTVTVNKWKETSFFVEDILKAQSQYNLLDEYTAKAGYAIAAQFDTDIIGAATFSQSQGTANTAFTDTVILNAFRLIDEANAPGEDRHFVIAPKGKRDYLLLDKYSLHTGPGYNTDESPILNGTIGDLYGAEVAISTQVTGALTATTTNLLFHREALAAAMQEMPRTQEQYKQEYLASLVTVDTIYGVNKLRDTFGCKVLN